MLLAWEPHFDNHSCVPSNMVATGYMWFLKKDIIYLFFREKGMEGGKRESKRDIDVREKYQLIACRFCPDLGLNPQPKHVP